MSKELQSSKAAKDRRVFEMESIPVAWPEGETSKPDMQDNIDEMSACTTGTGMALPAIALNKFGESFVRLGQERPCNLNTSPADSLRA